MNKLFADFIKITTIVAIVAFNQTPAFASEKANQALKIIEKGEAYLYNDPDSAIINFNQALKLLTHDKSTDAAKVRGDIYKKMGIANAIKSKSQVSIAFFKKAIIENKKTSDTSSIIANINNIGVALRDLGQYDKALNYFVKSLRIAESCNDIRMQSIANNNIATLFSMQEDFDKAIEYQMQSLKQSQVINDKKSIAKAYLNLGSYYIGNKKNLETGLAYQKKCIPIFEELKDYACLAIAYNNIGDILHQKKQYSQSDASFRKALSYAKLLGDKIKQSTINSELASLHLDIYKATKQRAELVTAEHYAQNALTDAQSQKVKREELTAYEILALTQKEFGNYRKAYEYDKRRYEIKDSLFNQEKQEIIGKIEARFLVDKKQKEINLLEQEKTIRLARAKQKNALMALSLLGIAFLLALTSVIYQKLHTSRAQKRIIEKQKLQVEQQNKILNEQNEEITTQKEQIEKHQEIMLDSINYSKRIQTAVLPSFPDTESIKSHFIIYRPKNIVSGDFYWFSRISEKTIIAVADCTGHGVPGGFLSMLGMTFLSEIVNREGHDDAALILERLRKRMINALQQKNEHNANKDGMDIALCVFDSNSSEVQFAGADCSLYVARNGSELQTIQGDRQPASIFPRMRPFTNHTIKIEPDNILYMSTDGYRDQFNEARKKFGSTQLKQMLEKISTLTMEEQKSEIERIFDEWKGNTKQIDDICMVGVQF